MESSGRELRSTAVIRTNYPMRIKQMLHASSLGGALLGFYIVNNTGDLDRARSCFMFSVLSFVLSDDRGRLHNPFLLLDQSLPLSTRVSHGLFLTGLAGLSLGVYRELCASDVHSQKLGQLLFGVGSLVLASSKFLGDRFPQTASPKAQPSSQLAAVERDPAVAEHQETGQVAQSL